MLAELQATMQRVASALERGDCAEAARELVVFAKLASSALFARDGGWFDQLEAPDAWGATRYPATELLTTWCQCLEDAKYRVFGALAKGDYESATAWSRVAGALAELTSHAARELRHAVLAYERLAEERGKR